MAAPDLTLTGRLIRLRPLGDADVPALLRQLPTFSSALDRADEEMRLRRMIAAHLALGEDGYVSLAVELEGELVGDIQARAPRHGFPPGVCEVGISLHEQARGRGVGTEAVGLFTAHLHRTGWPRVQSSTATGNVAMRRVLERCGYAPEGVLRSYAPRDGYGAAREDYVLYASVVTD